MLRPLLVFLLAAFFAAPRTYADGFVDVFPLKYFIYDSTGEAAVWGLATGLSTYENLVIPGYITANDKKYDVTSINQFAFAPDNDKQKLTGTLKLSYMLKYIGFYAFGNCKGLTGSLLIPSEVQAIAQQAFYGCTGMTGTLTFEDWGNLREIGNSAFSKCGFTGNLTIPKSVEIIDESAFLNCSSLTGELNIPNSVVTVGANAFYGCSGFTSLNIGKKVTTIGQRAFDNCTGLKSVTSNPSTPPTIGDNQSNAFSTSTLQGAQLNVASESLKQYRSAFGWKDFASIKGDKPEVSTVTLSQTSATLNVSQTLQLNATLSPADAYNESNTWKTSDANVASVSQVGLVTARGRGTATITVTTDNGKEATCSVTVLQPVNSIAVDLSASGFADGKAELRVGESKTLNVRINPGNANDKSLTFVSSRTDVVTVDGNGVVTANALGTSEITVRASSGVEAKITITVVPTPAASITLNEPSITFKATETVQLEATILPVTTTDKTVTWNSSDESVATVDATGQVTAVAVGTATVTATCGSVSATCPVTVVPTPAASLTIDKTEAALFPGEIVKLTAMILPETTTDKTVIWTSSNVSVATVAANGIVKAETAGHTTVTATCGSVSAECFITVKPTLPTFLATDKDGATVDNGALVAEYKSPVTVVIANPYPGRMMYITIKNNDTGAVTKYESSEEVFAVSLNEVARWTVGALVSVNSIMSYAEFGCSIGGYATSDIETPIVEFLDANGNAVTSPARGLPVRMVIANPNRFQDMEIVCTVNGRDTVTFERTMEIELTAPGTIDYRVYCRVASGYMSHAASGTFEIEDGPSGIAGPKIDIDDVIVRDGEIQAPEWAEIYTLGGIRIFGGRVAPGIYIVRVGCKSSKIVVK